MKPDRLLAATALKEDQIRRLFPSYRDFVDDALFHPQWGYYGAGRVRFGEGGHYDTYPLALSPLFGRMLAQYAYRFWRREGAPASFEICELGAGNGQLCVDVLLWVIEQSRHEQRWRQFRQALRYRIIERSAALISRQKQHLGTLAARVVWRRANLAESPPRTPLGPCGVVIANEVLDCLAHHKIIPEKDGRPSVAFVIPRFGGRAVPREALGNLLGAYRRTPTLTFQEVSLPLQRTRKLQLFLNRYYPEFFVPGNSLPPYYACPQIEPLVRNVARLYRTTETLWIDYGETRRFHLTASEDRRVFAGPPRSGATIYEAPGHHDITFMVDFSVVTGAAEQVGLAVLFYGPQAELTRRSGVRLDRQAVDLIVRHRALGWLLAMTGVGPERAWRQGGFTWSTDTDAHDHVPLRQYVKQSIAEFLARRRSPFKLLITRSDGAARQRARTA